MDFDGFEEYLAKRQADPVWLQEQAEEEARKKRATEDRRASILREACIPSIFLELLANGAKETEATEALKTVGAGTVVLSGSPGCGKTVASCAWLREIVVADGRVDGFTGYVGRVPLFVTSARLSRWDRYDNESMNRLLRADRLVIDDLGAEYADAKGNFAAILDEVVGDRHANRRPLVITTNLDAAAFKARYDERIADRIREVGRFVSLAGASMRKRAAND